MIKTLFLILNFIRLAISNLCLKINSKKLRIISPCIKNEVAANLILFVMILYDCITENFLTLFKITDNDKLSSQK